MTGQLPDADIGAWRILTKPFDWDELAAEIRRRLADGGPEAEARTRLG